MYKQLKVLILIAALEISGAANAALVSRLGGQAVYDTDLNITWLAAADGLMNWSAANAWAAGISVDGIRGWRLPTTVQPDVTCGSQSGDLKLGFYSYGYSCTGSEMGHLFYNELGGKAAQPISITHNANYNLFQYLGDNPFWSGAEDASNGSSAWDFYFGDGFQSVDSKTYLRQVLAVHPGDVGASTVPVPAAAWLFGSGLLGLAAGIDRRRAA